MGVLAFGFFNTSISFLKSNFKKVFNVIRLFNQGLPTKRELNWNE